MHTYDDWRWVINAYAAIILSAHDQEHGGFGTGQKFPQGRSLDYALDVYEQTGGARWLTVVTNTFENQFTLLDEIKTNYNLFDPVEGGFHRYGTTREWSPPHYEKMLYDNARLLRAYAHLQQLVDDSSVDTAVEKTLLYIKENWYDTAGGFFANTDVHGEEQYYGENPRPHEKPRVEKTKYPDRNADATVTYLDVS